MSIQNRARFGNVIGHLIYWKSGLILLCVIVWIGVALVWGDSLESGFLLPPEEARPWVYYFIMDGNLSREGITADFEAMQKAGLGGMILMEVDTGIPKGPVKFMSPEWREIFRHAVFEAQRFGLQITLNAGPGWTGSGGPWVKPEQSMQHLVASETTVNGPMHFDDVLPQPAPRKPFFGEGGLPAELETARKKFYRDVAVLAFPTPKEKAFIEDVEEKALYFRAPFSSQPGVRPFIESKAEYPAVSDNQRVSIESVIDLTNHLSPEGRLVWNVPEGNWTILRFGRTSTGQNTRPAPAAGLGFECDKFDDTALNAHFEAFVGSLLKTVGTPNRNGAGWTSLHIDSWEMSSQNWTTKFREEFQRRRGYDLLRYLPAITGRIVDSVEVSERFLWDLRKTAQDLVLENHAAQLKMLGSQHGLGLSIEPYDMNPAGDLSLGAAADVPMCEFWAKGYGFDTEFSCFESVSIAHTNGRSIVAAEAFTSDDRERWQLYPGVMKSQGDWALCAGINRIVFHRYQHQPQPDHRPGMTMGPYGVHWERTQTWWEMAKAYHEYLARCQWMLRQGKPVVDICLLAPEGAPHVFRAPKSATRGNPPDRLNYSFDGCAPETLIERMSVQDGRLVLPDGMNYRLLVLPSVETMTPALLTKIRQLIKDGGTIIGAPPRKSPSLSGYPACDNEIQKMSREIWGTNEFPNELMEQRFGKGRIFWGSTIGQGTPPKSKLQTALAMAKWIWYSEGNPAISAPVAQRYFRRVFDLNPNRRIQSAQIVMTADNRFELWVNGQRAGTGDNFHETYEFDVTSLLQPGVNILAVAAENGGDKPNPAGLVGCLVGEYTDGKTMSIPTDEQWQTSIRVKSNWMTDTASKIGWFCAMELGGYAMAPWNKNPNAMPEPELYPEYRGIVEVLTKMGVVPDFESDFPLRYIHRTEGDTEIYFVANPQNQPIATKAAFRVTGKQPQLWNPITTERRPLPEFVEKDGRTMIPLEFAANQSFFVMFQRAADTSQIPGCNFPQWNQIAKIAGPWEVRFEPNRGAPRQATFLSLIDWTKHADAGIRHFSGAATYSTQFDWKPTDAAAKQPVVLDLGRVEVMAQVKLNGRDLGIVWTPPLQIDATTALKYGANILEIRVANLWPNRLIADSALSQDQRITQTTWNPFSTVTPLLPSGLLGPVTLLGRQD
ncbi:MAG: hypothetical protein GX455_07825 [Phycisphaerae bacterium]|nr:hypothetical protein [Phycisphaerae bacterium]